MDISFLLEKLAPKQPAHASCHSRHDYDLELHIRYAARRFIVRVDEIRLMIAQLPFQDVAVP